MKYGVTVLVITAACHRSAPGDSIADLFAGTTEPAMVGPLKDIDWRMPFPQAADELRKRSSESRTFTVLADRVASIQEIDITTPPGHDVAAELEKLWGKPKVVTATAFSVHPAGSRIWYGDHVMAMAGPYKAEEQQHVALVQYVPFAEQLGNPAAPLFGFEKNSPIIGAKAADLATTLAPRYVKTQAPRPALLVLPYDETAPIDVSIELDDADVATRLSFAVRAHKELIAGYKDTLKKRFGDANVPDGANAKKTFAWVPPCPAGKKCNTPDHYDVTLTEDFETHDRWTIDIARATTAP